MRRAVRADVGSVLAVLDEAAAWLAGRGVVQWPERFDLEWVGHQVARGDTWLATAGGRAVGTLELAPADPAWAERPGPACYLHRLAVVRQASGLGRLLLGWAAAEARRRGSGWLRLDCVAANAGLRCYYEACGFDHVGDIEVTGPPGERSAVGPQLLVALFELALPPGPAAATRP